MTAGPYQNQQDRYRVYKMLVFRLSKMGRIGGFGGGVKRC